MHFCHEELAALMLLFSSVPGLAFLRAWVHGRFHRDATCHHVEQPVIHRWSVSKASALSLECRR